MRVAVWLCGCVVKVAQHTGWHIVLQQASQGHALVLNSSVLMLLPQLTHFRVPQNVTYALRPTHTLPYTSKNSCISRASTACSALTCKRC